MSKYREYKQLDLGAVGKEELQRWYNKDKTASIQEELAGLAAAAGLSTAVERPLEAWTLSFASDAATFDLQVEALSAPGEMAEGGMEGYDQLCRFAGDATVRREVQLDP